jgi:hypothetical protein
LHRKEIRARRLDVTVSGSCGSVFIRLYFCSSMTGTKVQILKPVSIYTSVLLY